MMISTNRNMIVQLISFRHWKRKTWSNRNDRTYTSLLSIIWWQLGQDLVGLLFHVTLSGSDALLIFVAILLPSTNHVLHKAPKNEQISRIWVGLCCLIKMKSEICLSKLQGQQDSRLEDEEKMNLRVMTRKEKFSSIWHMEIWSRVDKTKLISWLSWFLSYFDPSAIKR